MRPPVEVVGVARDGLEALEKIAELTPDVVTLDLIMPNLDPSVDLLFETAAATLGPVVMGAVLTGTGNDGLSGATAIRRAGGRVLTQSEDTCVVYGMPRAVVEAGQSDGVAPIESLATELVRRL